MTQIAERTVPYEVYERELERRKQAEPGFSTGVK